MRERRRGEGLEGKGRGLRGTKGRKEVFEKILRREGKGKEKKGGNGREKKKKGRKGKEKKGRKERDKT